MKRIAMLGAALAVLLTACAPASSSTPPSSAPSSAPTSSQEEVVPFTDMAGREIQLPEDVDVVESVYCTDPVGSLTVYTLAPDKLLGWNYSFNDQEAPYILPEYVDLPVYGMGDSVNLEAIIADAPDLCIQMGSLNEASIEKADKLQEQLGISVVMVSSALEDSPEAYEFLGKLLAEEEQAGKLADYARAALERAAAHPENGPTVYYGNGVGSLETAPVGSVSAEVFELLGADNVAKLEIESGSRVQVSAEQILGWNPAYIFVNGEPKQDLTASQAAQEMMDDPLYANVTAVQKGQVYGVPKAPFAWVDRPMGPNRLIGLDWVGSILYPDQYSDGLESYVKEFYSLFYHMELTDEQLTQLMDG